MKSIADGQNGIDECDTVIEKEEVQRDSQRGVYGKIQCR